MARDPMALYWETVLGLEKYKVLSRTYEWKFRDGRILFVNPIILCPFCREEFPSGRIWLFSVPGKRIVNVWHASDGTPVDDETEIWHPHAPVYEGQVCYGSNTEPVGALFLGVSAGEHARNSAHWVMKMGHMCKDIHHFICKVCKETKPKVGSMRWGPYQVCSAECHRKINHLCIRCITTPRSRASGSRGKLNYCNDCFDIIGVTCSMCGNKALSAYTRHLPNNFKICWDCASYRRHPCLRCGEDTTVWGLDSEGNCNRCKMVRCVGCGMLVRVGDCTDELRCLVCADLMEPPANEFMCRICEANIVDTEGDLCSDCVCHNCTAPNTDEDGYCNSCRPIRCGCACECGNHVPIIGAYCYYCDRWHDSFGRVQVIEDEDDEEEEEGD